MDAKNHMVHAKMREFARGISTVMLSLLAFVGVMYALTLALKALLG